MVQFTREMYEYLMLICLGLVELYTGSIIAQVFMPQQYFFRIIMVLAVVLSAQVISFKTFPPIILYLGAIFGIGILCVVIKNVFLLFVDPSLRVGSHLADVSLSLGLAGAVGVAVMLRAQLGISFFYVIPIVAAGVFLPLGLITKLILWWAATAPAEKILQIQGILNILLYGLLVIYSFEIISSSVTIYGLIQKKQNIQWAELFFFVSLITIEIIVLIFALRQNIWGYYLVCLMGFYSIYVHIPQWPQVRYWFQREFFGNIFSMDSLFWNLISLFMPMIFISFIVLFIYKNILSSILTKAGV